MSVIQYEFIKDMFLFWLHMGFKLTAIRKTESYITMCDNIIDLKFGWYHIYSMLPNVSVEVLTVASGRKVFPVKQSRDSCLSVVGWAWCFPWPKESHSHMRSGLRRGLFGSQTSLHQKNDITLPCLSVWTGAPMHRLEAKLVVDDFSASLSLTSSSTFFRSFAASVWDSSNRSPTSHEKTMRQWQKAAALT